jgi:hypothetical protein
MSRRFDDLRGDAQGSDAWKYGSRVTESIRNVLERRNDLSTFVVHFTRDSGGASAAQNLKSIIAARRLNASSPLGWAKDEDNPTDPTKQSQRVVCFTEAPLEHLHTFVREIEYRTVQMKPYGLAFTKLWARSEGINPILYVDMTPGADWALKDAVEAMVNGAKGSGFHDTPAAVIAPFMEQMGTWPNSQKEFWWEREWRHRGNLDFLLEDVAVWLCPEDEIAEFTKLIREETGTPDEPTGTPACIDPRWGLEHILLHILGRGHDVTPFPP